MAVDLSDEALVLLDTDSDGEVALRYARRCADTPVVLATVDSKYNDPDTTVIRSLFTQPTMTQVLKAAAARRAPFVVMRRDVAPPEQLVGELILGTGRTGSDALPGFAVVLTGADAPIRRILAVADRGTGPISGFMTHVAVTIAARNGAALDMLIVGAPGEEISAEDEHEALAINREQEYLDEAMALAQRFGVEVNWLAADVDGATWAVVGNQIRSGGYDLVVDEIGEITLAGRLRSGITIEESMSPGHAAELSVQLLRRTELPVVLVIDAIRVGIVVSPLMRAGAIAAAAVAVVAGGMLPSIMESEAGSAAAAGTSLPETPSPQEVLAELETVEKELAESQERAASAAGSSRSAAKSTATSTQAAKPKIPAGGARKTHVTKAKNELKASQKAYNTAKAKLAAAKATQEKAAADLAAAEAAISSSVREITSSSEVLAQAEAQAADVRADASGLTGLLPGGATGEDVEIAEEKAAAAQEWAADAATRGEEALADFASVEGQGTKAEEKISTVQEKVDQAKADLADAKAQTAAVQASYNKYLKAKAAAEAKAKAARAKALANAKVTPVASGSYRLSARYGQAGGYWSSGYHTGLDFAASSGTSVRAAASGKVVKTGSAGPYGNQIIIDHGNGVQTSYNHLSSIGVSPGQRVTAGDRIGAVGSTGNSTGPHLHFEVLRNGSQTNPASWLGM